MAMGDFLEIKHKTERGDVSITCKTLWDVITAFKVPYDGSKLSLDPYDMPNGLYVLVADVVNSYHGIDYKVVGNQSRALYYLLVSDGSYQIKQASPTVTISDGTYTTQALMVEDGNKLTMWATHLPTTIIVTIMPSVDSFALRICEDKIHDLTQHIGGDNYDRHTVIK